MAKQSPYALSRSEGHIMSQFGARLATPINVKEIRLSINGWVSQALVHDCPYYEQIQPSDLTNYVTDKGYALSGKASLMDKAVARLTNTVAGSKPLHAEYIPGYGMWRLGVAESKLDWPIGLDSLAEQIRIERKEATNYMFYANTSKNVMIWAAHVPSWRVGPDGNKLVGALMAKGAPQPTDAIAKRIKQPIAWFEDKLRAAGVPMELFKYDGIIDSCSRSVAWPSAAQGVGAVYAGGTRIVGPIDALGYRPIWTGPQLGNVTLWICDAGGGYQGTVTQIGLNCRWKTYLPTVSITGLSTAEASTAAPAAGFDTANPYGYNLFAEGAVSAKFTHDTAGRPGYAAYPYVTTIDTLLPFATGTWVGVAGPVPSVMQFKQSKWMIANGNGVVEWKHQAAAYVPAGLAADGFGVETWTATPSAVMFRASMAAIRDYIALQLTRDDLSPTDTAKLNRALVESEPYIDALISVTVSDHQVSACSLADVQGLEMVTQAKKGDVDLLTEDLGSGVTLVTLGKRLDSLRVKGRKFCTYGHVVDEAATTDQIVSARVAGTIDTAISWDLSLVINGLDGPVAYGAYNAGQKEVLTSTEVALLWINGARSQDGTIGEAAIATTLGMGADWKADLQTLGSQKLIGTGAGRTAWGQTAVNWDKFSAFSFCDYQGYPVVGFADKDTLVRQQLLFKAGESDPADLACAIFFANQLSFVE